MNIAWKPRVCKKVKAFAPIVCSSAIRRQTNRILNAANQALTPLAEKGHKFKRRKKGTFGQNGLRMLAQSIPAQRSRYRGAFAAKPEKITRPPIAPQLGRIEDVSDWQNHHGMAQQPSFSAPTEVS